MYVNVLLFYCTVSTAESKNNSMINISNNLYILQILVYNCPTQILRNIPSCLMMLIQ